MFRLRRRGRIACATVWMDPCVLCRFVGFVLFFHTGPWNCFFFGFGLILGGFGTHFGSLLTPFWRKTSIKTGIEKRCSKRFSGESRLIPARGGGPLKLIILEHPQDQHGHSNTPLRALRARWRIYIYIYIYITQTVFHCRVPGGFS